MRMLITGGTGSLGTKLVEHFKKYYKIRVFSRDEDKHSKMKDVEHILGDVRDLDVCYEACKDCDFVIHAAALKRIEYGEMFPWEFIATNVIGTKNIVDAAKMRGVGKFVLISTDKACKPINVYGTTKLLAEKIVTLNGFNCVRYGNVSNSRGSVLPFWKEEAENKRPIPLTSKDMTRFLIDFDEAIKIIDTALMKMDGCVYVPKLDAANMYDIAKLFSDNIEIVGERMGEKIAEELINLEEFRGRVTDEATYYKIHPKPGKGMIETAYSSDTARRLKGDELKERLRPFLPNT